MIEKILERARSKALEYIHKSNEEASKNGNTLDFERFCGKKEAYEDMLVFVQEVAKEYGNVEVGEIVIYDGEPFAIETVKCTKEPCREKMLTIIAKEVHLYQKGEVKKDCSTCANNTDFEEIDNGCYMCCKGLENNYVPKIAPYQNGE